MRVRLPERTESVPNSGPERHRSRVPNSWAAIGTRSPEACNEFDGRVLRDLLSPTGRVVVVAALVGLLPGLPQTRSRLAIAAATRKNRARK